MRAFAAYFYLSEYVLALFSNVLVEDNNSEVRKHISVVFCQFGLP